MFFLISSNSVSLGQVIVEVREEELQFFLLKTCVGFKNVSLSRLIGQSMYLSVLITGNFNSTTR